MWSKLDEINAARIDEKCDNIVLMKNLTQDKNELENKYNYLKAELNKMLEDSVRNVQLENYAKLKKRRRMKKILKPVIMQGLKQRLS